MAEEYNFRDFHCWKCGNEFAGPIPKRDHRFRDYQEIPVSCPVCNSYKVGFNSRKRILKFLNPDQNKKIEEFYRAKTKKI